MNRKEFLTTCGMSCLGGTALALFLQSCSGAIYYAQNSVSNNKVVIRKSEFLRADGDATELRQFVLVRLQQSRYPICVYRLSDTEYSAVLMECTHKGCELRPSGDFLMCPCHGSEFSNTGVVQNPPAEKNLHVFTTSTDNENIYLQL